MIIKKQFKNNVIISLSVLFVFLSSFFLVFAQSGVKEKKIALTFDDGPYGVPTTTVLDILKKENVHATFFLIGENIQKYPDIVREIVADGNIIGNHTYDHPKNLTSEDIVSFNKEIDSTENLITATTNLSPAFFRAPYGATSPKIIKELKQKGYTLVKWQVDPEDWNYPKVTSDIIVKNVIKDAKPNAVVLLHDGRDTKIDFPRDNMIEALPKIISELKNEGYTFVTVDQINGKKAYK